MMRRNGMMPPSPHLLAAIPLPGAHATTVAEWRTHSAMMDRMARLAGLLASGTRQRTVRHLPTLDAQDLRTLARFIEDGTAEARLRPDGSLVLGYTQAWRERVLPA